MGIELRHLRYFLAVAEELHFGRAAERLRIAQPSLSQQIRKLEREMGVELFDRTNQRVRLSPAGEALLPGALKTLEGARESVDRAREAGAGMTGHLNVGFIETAAIKVVPEAVRRFRAGHPRISLTLLELGVEEQIQGLISGRLDLGFVRERPAVKGLTTETVLEERLILAVPAGHPFADRTGLATTELNGEAFVGVERGVLPELHDETIAMLRGHGHAGDFAQKASSVLAVLGLVSAGLGLAVLPASVQDLRLSGVEYINLEGSPRTTILVVRSERSASLHLQPFLEAVSRSAGR